MNESVLKSLILGNVVFQYDFPWGNNIEELIDDDLIYMVCVKTTIREEGFVDKQMAEYYFAEMNYVQWKLNFQALRKFVVLIVCTNDGMRVSK